MLFASKQLPPLSRFVSLHTRRFLPVCCPQANQCFRHFHSNTPISWSAESHAAKPPSKDYERVERIILVRHGESLGNIDEASYATTADWLIPLTQRGRRQARAAGREIQHLVSGDGNNEEGKVFFYVSPYLRTKQTLRGILMEVDRDRVVGLKEEPRVSEQQFGNFQNVELVRDAKSERSDYGRFYYRFPNGESGFDVYSRATSFIATMFRDVEQLSAEGYDPDQLNVCIVTHGLTLRLLLMRWFQYTVHEFEESRNPDNGSVVVLERHTNRETGLQWYELKDEARMKLKLPAFYEQIRFHIADDLTLLDNEEWDEGTDEDDV